MAWSVSQRCRKARQLDGSESGFHWATWLLMGTGRSTVYTIIAAKRAVALKANHLGVLHVECAINVTPRLKSNVSAYQNGIALPRPLANV